MSWLRDIVDCPLTQLCQSRGVSSEWHVYRGRQYWQYGEGVGRTHQQTTSALHRSHTISCLHQLFVLKWVSLLNMTHAVYKQQQLFVS